MDDRPGGPEVTAPLAEAAAPVAPPQRIALLDTLRGFALLGILPMNIPTFAFSYYAYMYPPLSGGFPGPDMYAWAFGHVFFEMKMMTIFSMLFGAGVVLLTSRHARRGSPATALFLRRSAWLAIIGLLHAYLLWYGDILFSYALCGLVVFAMRRARPRTLITVGLLLMLIPTLVNLGIGAAMHELRAAALEATAALDPGEAPHRGGAVEAWEGFRSSFYPTAETVAAERAAREGGFLDYLRMNAPQALEMQTFLLLLWGVWRITGAMLLGAALLKLGFLDGRASTRACAMLGVGGLAIGLPLAALGACLTIADHFDIVMLFLRDSQLNYWASLPAALGYTGCIALLVRSGALTGLLSVFADIGRMALTNYLAQTILCLLLFTSLGLNLWNQLSRVELWGCVIAIWLVQAIVSVLWLRRFQFGPAEWLWRSLTYGRLQPLRATPANPHA